MRGVDSQENGTDQPCAPTTSGSAPENDVPPAAEAVYTVQVRMLGSGNLFSISVNGTDTLLDVRQFIAEQPETCFVTHYVLRHNGAEVNDLVEIGTLSAQGAQGGALLASLAAATPPPGAEKANSAADTQSDIIQLQMAEASYDDRSVRTHVRRLRELLSPPQETPASSIFGLGLTDAGCVHVH